MDVRCSRIRRQIKCFIILSLAIFVSSDTSVLAQKAEWIWSPKQSVKGGLQSQGECFFRKKFTLIRPEQAEIEFAAGDEYEIHINGRLVTRGQSFGTMTKIDVKSHVVSGVNVMAVRVKHHEGDKVGLSLTFRCKEKDEIRWRGLATDGSWKTRLTPGEYWKLPTYNDMGWLAAQTLKGQDKTAIAKSPTKQTPTNPQKPWVANDSNPASRNPAQAQNSASNSIAAKTKPVEVIRITGKQKQTQDKSIVNSAKTKVDQQTQRAIEKALAQSTAKASDKSNADANTENASAENTSAKPNNKVQSKLATDLSSSPKTNPATQSKPDLSQATASAAKPKVKIETAQALPAMADEDPAPPKINSPVKPKVVMANAKPQQEKPDATKPAKKGQVNFEIDDEFTIQKVLAPSETGSLIAMEFNEFGKLLLSREGGPLLIADPTVPLGHPERIRTYCPDVTNCQGIVPLNGDVFVTAMGPKGMGLYQLSDVDKNGQLEVQKKLLGFTGEPGEHGPHGIQLGPDGMLYVIVGNGSQVDTTVSDASPYRHFYEGDLIPRYEDPGGHAKGVKAPGGTVIRCSLDGTNVERVCGGIRNAYDLVFDHQGELFIHDSDMEADAGMTWYRPTYVYHVPHGAEFGWRSGWSKFPQHFVDQTPAVVDTGRGSPTGAVLYQHLQYPIRYQNTIFLADWSEGRILALRTKPSGAGFTATTETFLKGRPLNVVDLAIGEDGSLYFCTGGRGTEGGVYRVVWNGDVPENMLNFDTELAKVIRHPQPNAAWARQNIAQLKLALGESWGSSLEGVANEKRNSTNVRIRAMQLMVLYGPVPSESLIASLSRDEKPEIRAQIARLCGLKDDTFSEVALNRMIGDDNPLVRRVAGESMLRRKLEPELSAILPLLSSTDRIEAMVARRLIERIPAERWEDDVFTTEDKRLFIQGSVALMTADPTLDRAYQVLARASKFMEGFVNDYDFVDMLRTMELALVRGEIDPAKVPGLVIRIGNEFPSSNSTINRELVRLMAYLKAGDLNGRIEEYLTSDDVSIEDKVHFGMFMQSVGPQLTSGARLTLIDAMEKAVTADGTGGSYRYYLERGIQDLSKSITLSDVKSVLEHGHEWPSAAIAAFYKLPEKVDSETVNLVIEMDQNFRSQKSLDATAKQCRLGIIAILARNGDDASMAYLRQLWEQEESRRGDIVIGLAEQPEGENWAYLVSSLPLLDDLTGKEVMQKLAAVPRKPREARHYRDTIELGYRLRQQGATEAIQLLKHWTGEELETDGKNWDAQLADWQGWFQQTWPHEPALSLVSTSKPVAGLTTDIVLSNLESHGLGDIENGMAVFAKAQCATCHQFEGNGQGVGPDLSAIANRYSLREVVEATVDPSKVIPPRYASKKILTIDGNQFVGMAVEQADGSYFLLQKDGKRIRIAASEIEEIQASDTSAMPHGLLNELTNEEVRDLFSYLMQVPEQPQSQQAGSPSVSSILTGKVR